jgi:hypothetical protein
MAVDKLSLFLSIHCLPKSTVGLEVPSILQVWESGQGQLDHVAPKKVSNNWSKKSRDIEDKEEVKGWAAEILYHPP